LSNKNFRLSSSSLAIDTGSPGLPIGSETDFEGNLVPRDGNGDGMSIADLGVYEYTVSTPPSDTIPPSTPTNLQAVTISTSQINLSWNVSTDNVGVTGYRIYRDGSQISTTANTTYQDTGLSPSTTYMYTVSAIDGAGNESVLSTGISATTNNGSLFEDDFQRLDSGIVGNGWIEAESGSQVKISNGRLVFDAKDDSFRPLIHHNYLSQSSGIITWTFDLNFQRTGSEGTYSFWMQLGQESLMDTAAPMDKGIAVNLKWGGPNDGFSTHEGLGYVVDGLVTQVATVSGGNERITVSVDLDNNTYNVSIGGQEVTNIPLENNVSIDTVRFFAHNLNLNNFAYREIDNVVINGGGNNPVVDSTAPFPPSELQIIGQ
jgi:hypothetical protein